MAKIIDPDLLNQATEITFDTSAKTIALAVAGNLSNDGVAIQCIYSFCKEEWKTDATLIKHPFPLKPIDGPSGTQFDLIGDWSWANTTSTGLIRDGGWALKDGAGVSQEEWMNVTSLGAFLDPGSDQAYYTQGDIDSPTDITLTGEVNQAIQVYGDGSHGDFDYRGDFIIYLREEQKTYDQYDLIVAQNISALTYKKYAMPLSNGTDLKATHDDTAVALAPYTNIDITWHSPSAARDVGGSSYDFDHIVEGDNKTLEQIYEKVMYQQRQVTDIDEGAGAVRGDTSDKLMYFVGDTLYVDGYIDNILSADSNRVVFIDDGGIERVNPYAAAGALNFNAALQNDADSIYRLFFTNDDAGDNAGYDFGTDNAIIVENNSDIAISGDISAQASIDFDYDYDGNIQRGAASAGTDVPVTLVGIGLSGGQYVAATGTITRSKANSVSLVSSDELTYSNP